MGTKVELSMCELTHTSGDEIVERDNGGVPEKLSRSNCRYGDKNQGILSTFGSASSAVLAWRA